MAQGGRGGAPKAQPQQQQAPQTVAAVQEGSRWRYNRPSGEEVASWFAGNVHLHDKMEHDRYVQGVVLIPASEKVKRTVLKTNGDHMTIEGWDQIFTPYAKVETRVAYFWDLMAIHPEWVGVIEPVPVPRLDTQGYRNHHLPRGFFKVPVQKGSDQWVDYLGCGMRVRVFERDALRIELREDPVTGEVIQHYVGKTVLDAPPATKMVATLTSKNDTDPFAIMKAETGAIGRALGMAGMLVIPGSGVATAEDMFEAAAAGGDSANTIAPEAATLPGETAALPLAAGGTPAASEPTGAGAEPPDAEAQEKQMRERITTLTNQLAARSEDALDRFRMWAVEKKIDFENLKEHQLRGTLRKLEQLLEELDQAGQAQA
jgi:hypothetical protein